METLIQSESFICWKLKHVLFKQKSSIFRSSNQPCTCCKCRHEIGDNTALIVMMREMRLRLLPIRRQCPQIVSCRTGPSSTLGHGIRTFMVSSGSFSFAQDLGINLPDLKHYAFFWFVCFRRMDSISSFTEECSPKC